MSRAYIVSTATTPIAFVEYHEHSLQKGQLPVVKRRVVIKGGANLPDKALLTPNGVATPVNADDLAFLMQDRNFLKMMADGFMQIISDDRDTEAAASSMKPKDGSAPKTDKDYALVDKEKNRSGSRQPNLEHVGRALEDITG